MLVYLMLIEFDIVTNSLTYVLGSKSNFLILNREKYPNLAVGLRFDPIGMHSCLL